MEQKVSIGARSLMAKSQSLQTGGDIGYGPPVLRKKRRSTIGPAIAKDSFASDFESNNKSQSHFQEEEKDEIETI